MDFELVSTRKMTRFSNIASFTQGMAAIELTYFEYLLKLVPEEDVREEYQTLVSFTVASPARSRVKAGRWWLPVYVSMLSVTFSAISALANYSRAKTEAKTAIHDAEAIFRDARGYIGNVLQRVRGQMPPQLPIDVEYVLKKIEALPEEDRMKVLRRAIRLNGQITNRRDGNPTIYIHS